MNDRNLLNDFCEEIKYKNRNPKNTEILKMLDDYETNPTIVLQKGELLYRSRIIDDVSKIKGESPFYGYDANNSFVPPKNKTKDMRANYRNIPYLYCAADKYTSIVEVRPTISSKVSVATIQIYETLKLFDLTIKNNLLQIPAQKKTVLQELSELYSKPVNDDELLDYIPTQFIAEYIKNNNYDGIAYMSSLTPEIKTNNFNLVDTSKRYNVVIFNYDKCKVIKSNVYSIDKICFEPNQIDDDTIRDNPTSAIIEELSAFIGDEC